MCAERVAFVQYDPAETGGILNRPTGLCNAWRSAGQDSVPSLLARKLEEGWDLSGFDHLTTYSRFYVAPG